MIYFKCVKNECIYTLNTSVLYYCITKNVNSQIPETNLEIVLKIKLISGTIATLKKYRFAERLLILIIIN